MNAQTTQVAFLGVIAISALALAVGAIVAAVYAGRAMRRLERAVAELRGDLGPLIERATVVTEDARRITTLVAAQVERADALVGDFTRRMDEVVSIVQSAIVTPAREGMAVVAALRAVFETLRGFRSSRPAAARAEEEDALFIG